MFYYNLVLITLSTFCSKHTLGTGQVSMVRTAQTEASKEVLNLGFLSIGRSIMNHLGNMLKLFNQDFQSTEANSMNKITIAWHQHLKENTTFSSSRFMIIQMITAGMSSIYISNLNGWRISSICIFTKRTDLRILGCSFRHWVTHSTAMPGLQASLLLHAVPINYLRTDAQTINICE